MIKKIFIDALNYFSLLSQTVILFIVVLLIYIIAYIKGKWIGKKIMELYKRFKR